MNITNNFEISFNGLKANKLRSTLTMLGVIIGVSAVIIMIAVGQGASKRISDQISSMGSNLLMVFPGAGQGAVARKLALWSGLSEPEIVRDLAGYDRVLVARRR